MTRGLSQLAHTASFLFATDTTYILYAYTFLFFNTILSPIYLFVLLLVINGLREAAAALADPFGNDDVDFPLERYVHKIRITSAVMLKGGVLVEGHGPFVPEGSHRDEAKGPTRAAVSLERQRTRIEGFSAYMSAATVSADLAEMSVAAL